MAEHTLSTLSSSEDDSSFEDIDRLSLKGHKALDENPKEAATAALEEDTKDILCDENARLRSKISRIEDEMRKAEGINRASIDQLTQLNGILMRENEDLQAKVRPCKVDEDIVIKDDAASDDHQAKFKKYVDKMKIIDYDSKISSGIIFVFTLCHTLFSFFALHERTWFNIPSIFFSVFLSLFSLDDSIYSSRTILLRLIILILDVLWLFIVNPKMYFILMAVKSLLVVLCAWSMSFEMSTRHTEKRDRLVSACCPAKFAGAEALRDGMPRIVEIKKSAGSLGIFISKIADSPVYIAQIIPNGAAEKEGGLRAGDEILKVNGKTVSRMTKEEVVAMLACIDGTVTFEVRNNKKLVADQI